MKNNPAFQKSVHFLIQPYTLLALFIYAINEFILQSYYPSWLSGKLSDFTWLFVAPVAASFLLALLIPVRWKNQTQWVSALAYGLTAIFFIGLKTFLPFRDLVLESWLVVFKFPAAVELDPTDLLALLILPLSWVLWAKSNQTISRPIPLRAAWVLPVFALLSIADMPSSTDSGISYLRLQNDKIVASSDYGIFTSPDGGMTWNVEIEEYNPIDFKINPPERQKIAFNNKNKLAYRITKTGNIEQSSDFGNTWNIMEGYDEISDIEAIYYDNAHREHGYLSRTPLDILYDPTSGNVILARSLAGVLVITPNGKISKIAVGRYRPSDINKFETFIITLSNHFRVAILLFLIFISIWFVMERRWINHVLLIVLVLGWIFLLSMVLDTAIGAIMFNMGFLILAVFLFLFSSFNIGIAIHRKHKQAWKCFPYALIGSLLFLIPYFLWYEEILTTQITSYLSLGLTGFWIIVGIIFTKIKYAGPKRELQDILEEKEVDPTDIATNEIIGN